MTDTDTATAVNTYTLTTFEQRYDRLLGYEEAKARAMTQVMSRDFGGVDDETLTSVVRGIHFSRTEAEQGRRFFEAELNLYQIRLEKGEHAQVAGTWSSTDESLPESMFPAWSEVVIYSNRRSSAVSCYIDPVGSDPGNSSYWARRYHLLAVPANEYPALKPNRDRTCAECSPCDCGECEMGCEHVVASLATLEAWARMAVPTYAAGCPCRSCAVVLGGPDHLSSHLQAMTHWSGGGWFTSSQGKAHLGAVLRWVRHQIVLGDEVNPRHEEVNSAFDPLAMNIPSLDDKEAEVAMLRVALDELKDIHQAVLDDYRYDVEVAIGGGLHEAATKRGWCAEYEKEESKINARVRGRFFIPAYVRPKSYRIIVGRQYGRLLLKYTFTTGTLPYCPTSEQAMVLFREQGVKEDSFARNSVVTMVEDDHVDPDYRIISVA